MGTGNYGLCSQNKKFYIKEAVFRAKCKENRDNYFYKFLGCKKQSNNEVKSATCNYSIPNKAKCVAKTPQQTKRPRNAKTSKKFALKNHFRINCQLLYCYKVRNLRKKQLSNLLLIIVLL